MVNDVTRLRREHASGLTMSRENVERIRASFEHFVATGEPQWEITSEEIEIHDHDIPDASEYRGHAGYVRWLEGWASAWSSYEIVPEDVIDAGDRVVATLKMTATGRGSGIALERTDAMVIELRDGMAVRIDYLNNVPQALEAAGLTEPPSGS